MNKQKLLEKLDKAWTEFQDSYAGLPEPQMTEPGVTGDWSVKEIIAHVSAWEEEALKYLPLILGGGRPPRYSTMYGGIDAFNVQMTERKRELSLAEIMQEAETTHRKLVETIQDVSEEQFARETRFRRRVRLDTYGHYLAHAEAIREWRERTAR